MVFASPRRLLAVADQKQAQHSAQSQPAARSGVPRARATTDHITTDFRLFRLCRLVNDAEDARL